MRVWTSRCPYYRDALKWIAELEAQVAELSRKLKEAMRAGKRQVAPFRKEPPKSAPKPPGRKSGDAHGTHGLRAPPPSVPECHHTPLPGACPHCREPLIGAGTAEQFHTKTPRQSLVRKFFRLGRCPGCGAPVHRRHPLMTSDALGAVSQIGPDASLFETETSRRPAPRSTSSALHSAPGQSSTPMLHPATVR